MTTWDVSITATPYEYLETDLGDRFLQLLQNEPGLTIHDHGGGMGMGDWATGADIYATVEGDSIEPWSKKLANLVMRKVTIEEIEPIVVLESVGELVPA